MKNYERLVNTTRMLTSSQQKLGESPRPLFPHVVGAIILSNKNKIRPYDWITKQSELKN